MKLQILSWGQEKKVLDSNFIENARETEKNDVKVQKIDKFVLKHTADLAQNRSL